VKVKVNVLANEQGLSDIANVNTLVGPNMRTNISPVIFVDYIQSFYL